MGSLSSRHVSIFQGLCGVAGLLGLESVVGSSGVAMWREKRGQTLVEFALVLPILVLLLFGIIDLGWMFYVNLTMQHAVREGTRYAVTGRSDMGQDRRSALIEKIKKASSGLYEKNLHEPKEPRISVVSPRELSFSNYTGSRREEDPGESGEIIVVSLTYTCASLTPALKPFLRDGVYTFTVKSTMTNEPF